MVPSLTTSLWPGLCKGFHSLRRTHDPTMISGLVYTVEDQGNNTKAVLIKNGINLACSGPIPADPPALAAARPVFSAQPLYQQEPLANLQHNNRWQDIKLLAENTNPPANRNCWHFSYHEYHYIKWITVRFENFCPMQIRSHFFFSFYYSL